MTNFIRNYKLSYPVTWQPRSRRFMEAVVTSDRQVDHQVGALSWLELGGEEPEDGDRAVTSAGVTAANTFLFSPLWWGLHLLLLDIWHEWFPHTIELEQHSYFNYRKIVPQIIAARSLRGPWFWNLLCEPVSTGEWAHDECVYLPSDKIEHKHHHDIIMILNSLISVCPFNINIKKCRAAVRRLHWRWFLKPPVEILRYCWSLVWGHNSLNN